MFIHKCPKNITHMIWYLHPNIFPTISLEDFSFVEERAKIERGQNELKTQIPPDVIDSFLEQRLNHHLQKRANLIRLLQYGKNRDEIILGLNIELDSCFRCRRNYRKFLDIQINNLYYSYMLNLIGPYQSKEEADRDFLERYQEVRRVGGFRGLFGR